jgi:hypothetical protein
MSVADAPFGLEAPFPQPRVREGEALAAVVVLAVVDPDRAPPSEDGAVLRHAVRHAREQLHQVERGVGIMTHPEEEHVPVQFVHSTDGTLGAVGRER